MTSGGPHEDGPGSLCFSLLRDFGTDSVVIPPTRNPWDLDRILGGASGRSRATAAASLCLAALDSDTAGSSRIPISWTLDHVGPMTKTVEDVAFMLR